MTKNDTIQITTTYFLQCGGSCVRDSDKHAITFTSIEEARDYIHTKNLSNTKLFRLTTIYGTKTEEVQL